VINTKTKERNITTHHRQDEANQLQKRVTRKCVDIRSVFSGSDVAIKMCLYRGTDVVTHLGGSKYEISIRGGKVYIFEKQVFFFFTSEKHEQCFETKFSPELISIKSLLHSCEI
jgi:hypothetical protein